MNYKMQLESQSQWGGLAIQYDLFVDHARIGVQFKDEVLIVAGSLVPNEEWCSVERGARSSARIDALAAELHIQFPHSGNADLDPPDIPARGGLIATVAGLMSAMAAYIRLRYSPGSEDQRVDPLIGAIAGAAGRFKSRTVEDGPFV